mgnify:CR=1 FL=1
MADTRKTLVELLEEAHQKISGFVMAVEPAATSDEIKQVDEALDNILTVRNQLGLLKESVQEIIDTCSTRI